MKNENIERNIPTVRTRLHRKGVTSIKSEEIRELLTNNDNDVNAVTQLLLEKYQTAIAVDSGENVLETPPESEEDFKALLKINSVSNDDQTVAMIKSEAAGMGLTIPTQDISNIANSVKQSRTYQTDKIKAIKRALIAYIDWQHEQSSNDAVETIREVKQHATNKAIQFNNQMVGELSEFFRTQQESTDEFTNELIKALSVS
ncbi:hypothetical protein [Nostoc phage YongM]|nr:hypothetical protein [Nostoc phage YongM]